MSAESDMIAVVTAVKGREAHAGAPRHVLDADGLCDVAARRADQAVDTAFIADLLRLCDEGRPT